jgi:hypothetical protein
MKSKDQKVAELQSIYITFELYPFQFTVYYAQETYSLSQNQSFNDAIEEMQLLNNFHHFDVFIKFTDQEKKILWKYRYEYKDSLKLLPIVLQCAQYFAPGDVSDISNLLQT